MAKALTPAAIDRFNAPATRREVPDPALSGLYLILQPSGAKSWAVRYRYAGKPRKMTLGRWPVVGLADARMAASEALAAVEEGRDPGAEKIITKKERVEQADRNSVRAVVDLFARRHLSNLRRGEEAKSAFRRYVVAQWGDRDIGTITRRDVIDLLDDIMDSGKAVTANRVRAHLSKFFNWCIERDIVDASPMAGVKAPAKEASRDRVLSNDEIRWFWQACEEAGQPWTAFGKLLLLTGQRRSEVAEMSDREIKDNVWHLAPERTKNKRAHAVPLSTAARSVLDDVERIKGPSGYIITTTGETPISGFQKARLRIAEHMEQIAAEERGEPVEIPHWSFHDLRRTAATGLARLNVPVRVTEAVLNHVSGTGGGIVAVYQRHDYADEKRNALEAWGRLVLSIVEGGADNVVRLAK